MLKDGGLVPNGKPTELESQPKQPDLESEGAAVEEIATAIVKLAVEKHRAFGIPLPEADEAEEQMRAKS